MATARDNSLLEKVTFHSPAMQAIQTELDPLFVDSARPLLFWDEPGSGAAFYARAIHRASRTGEFLRFSLISLNEEDVKADFFGNEEQSGWLQKADKGTIFIREVSETSLSVQRFLVHLLKIQSVDGRLEFPRSGSTEIVNVNVRFIFSMSQNPTEARHEKRLLPEFDDLLKNKGKIINHPPLRERKEDIIAIAHNFFETFNQQYEQHISGFDEKAKQALIDYNWFGNIDELKEEIHNIFAQKPEIDIITTAHLPRHILSPDIPGEGKLYSFKLKNGERVRARFRSPLLHIQKADRKRLRINTGELSELTRVVDNTFAPPRFKHYLLKLHNGDQIVAETLLDKRIQIETSFASSYAVKVQEIDSILRV